MNLVKQSYLTGSWYILVMARLEQLYHECERLKHLNTAAISLMSIEILKSLNTESLPVGGNLYHFRKSIVTEFHKKFRVDINLGVSLSAEIENAGDIDTLVTEYHVRIFNCLKVVLRYIAFSSTGETPCQDTRRRSITG